MSSEKNEERDGSGLIIFSMVTAIILIFFSLIMRNSDEPMIGFFSYVCLLPFNISFSKTFYVFIAAIVFSFGATFFSSVFSWYSKSKFYHWIIQTIAAYFVCIGSWYYLKTMGLTIRDVFANFDNLLIGIVLFLASIVLLLGSLVGNFSVVCQTYGEIFDGKSDSSRSQYKEDGGVGAGQPTSRQASTYGINPISDQTAIRNLYKDLDKVEQLLNMNLNTEAAIALRKVSELFTKEISIHNYLGLEKVDYHLRVQSLYEQQYISYELFNLLTTIRRLGNKAAHEYEAEKSLGKNGLYKLRRQLLEHINEWVVNEQREWAAGKNVDFDHGFEQANDNPYEGDYGEHYRNNVEENNIDVHEGEGKPRRSAAFTLLPKERREKMKF